MKAKEKKSVPGPPFGRLSSHWRLLNRTRASTLEV